jgi:hypothetical protein
MRIRLRQLTAGTLLLALSQAGLAVEQSYLDAVMADYAEFTTGRYQPPGDLAWSGQAGESDGTLSLADFSAFVKRKFRGTYILFSRLPKSQKNAIWQEYLKTGDLGGIRSNIYAARRGGKLSKKRTHSTLDNLPLDF